MTETNNQHYIEEIEILKAKIAELESKLNKQKKQHEPVSCSICHKTFKNEYILKTHINSIHNKERPTFECQYCHKMLKSKYYLERHINHIHADELKNKEEMKQQEMKQKQKIKLCHLEEEQFEEEQTNEFEEEEEI